MEQEVKKIDIQLSMIVADLDNGLTWKTSEDVGYGSIQTKYNLKDFQVEIIRKHPKLKDLKPNIVLINIIDDLGEKSVELPKELKPKVESQPTYRHSIEENVGPTIQTIGVGGDGITSEDIKSFMNM